MNFFEQQEKARHRTTLLVFLYIVAVVGTVVAVYVAARLTLGLSGIIQSNQTTGYAAETPSFSIWDLPTFIMVCLAVGAVIVGATLYRIFELSAGGGPSVAEMLGGVPIKSNTKDPEERKVLDVVEEMSVASGVPVPSVYILKDELGINAFAAGFSQKDTIVGITEGAVKMLSRDEIQGVVAHEFSHIFNGDMRLNMYLIGGLSGLIALSMIGKIILRIRIQSRERGVAGVLVMYAFAFALLLAGWIGMFFCKMIKALISQQREFLADASAVQYTRNPAGIAGALKKIGGLSDYASMISNPRAEEASHFFFADGICLSELFATHPPLAVRIKLIDPSFDGVFPPVKRYTVEDAKPLKPRIMTPVLEGQVNKMKRTLSAFQIPAIVQSVGAVAAIGTLSSEQLESAGEIIGGIPKVLKLAASEPVDSQALVYAMLLSRFNEDVKTKQLDWLAKNLDDATFIAFQKLMPEFSALPPNAFLPLLDLATPMLKSQSQTQYESFRQNVEGMIHLDQTVSVFKFVLKQVVLHHLDFVFGKATRTKEAIPLRELLPECEILLSYLAQSPIMLPRDLAAGAFLAAAKQLDGERVWKLIVKDALEHSRVEDAMQRLESALPQAKSDFLKACETCVMCDGKLDVAEMELLRAFSSALDCPMPPMALGVSVK